MPDQSAPDVPALPRPPSVPGLPLLGNAHQMAGDPAAFFVRCYRRFGPVFRVSILGAPHVVLAGPDAALFLASPEGRASLRSKELWQGLIDEFGASKMVSAEDGDLHRQLRTLLQPSHAREAAAGRYDEVVALTRAHLDEHWAPGGTTAVLPALQRLVAEQIGVLLTGSASRPYIDDVRDALHDMLNAVVTHQRPAFVLRLPRYRRAKRRLFELGELLIRQYEEGGPRPDRPNVLDAVMEAHARDPELVQRRDLVMMVTAPYAAGLDTVANTLAAAVYAVLKHPDVLARVQAEVDALFSQGPIDEASFMGRVPTLHGAILETMRLFPIAVAQPRVATRDFAFAGHRILAGERVFLGTSVAHFLDEHFADAARFDPDRFAPPRSEHLKPGVYSPYGRGPHICLGKNLADVLMALTLATLFHGRTLALPSPGYVLRTKTAPTPGPSPRFSVRVLDARAS